MLISHEKLREINKIQIDILKAVADACKQLNIPFYMVHGSLLGTVRNNKFVPDDDDIDIAIFRDQYEIFLKEAPKFLESRYFVQSHDSDKEYPLEFAKVRDSQTTYVVDVAQNLKINHGIYIDVFPIDFYPESNARAKIKDFQYKLLNLRITSVFSLKNVSFSRKLARFAAKAFYPSISRAIQSRDKLLQSEKEGTLVRVSGGKIAERALPFSWFDKPVQNVFENVPVYIPNEYAKYLTKIYGNYQTITLVENKEVDRDNIEINACVVDTKVLYTNYI